MKIRYFSNSKFPVDCAFLQPSRFNEKIPEEAFTKLVEHLVNHDESITRANLLYELQDFSSKWDRLKLTLDEEYEFDNFSDEEPQFELEESTNNSNLEIEKKSTILCNKIKACRNCILCCYTVLLKYNLYSEAYKTLFYAYKFFLSLSSTQVACERMFSKLKYILNRIRYSLSQDHLESFMLMSAESDILMALYNEIIIDTLSQKSSNLNKLLNI